MDACIIALKRKINVLDIHNKTENIIPLAQRIIEKIDDYREHRDEYACQLMTDNPKMSISDVATASGFSNLTVFGRDFKRKYEVTPTYFKCQMTAKK